MTNPKDTDGPSRTGDFERLRTLIFGEEKNRLHNLDRRVSDLESRTADVAEVLPGAMNRVVDDPVTKPDLEQPVVDIIRGAIRRDTESFAEALFPVLGPAIRRAVADALKSLVQRINVALENSFTVKGLRWRIEAARTGVPFAQVVLRHTMEYSIQEAFLIQRESGLLLCGVHRDESLALDDNAVSAMLTAIQAFIQDSLGMPRTEPLRSAELGDRTLWVINGPDAVLACIIIGEPPRDVRIELMRILETLHAQYGSRFDDHPEQVENDAGVIALMQEVLREKVDDEVGAASSRNFKWYWIGLAALIVTVVAWGGWNSIRDYRLESATVSRFGAEPGYMLTGFNFEDGVLYLAGLRDPLADDPATLLEELGIDVENTELAFRPYQSLEEEMMLRRLHQALGDEGSVVLALDGSRLNVEGSLTAEQRAILADLPASHPVIRSVNFRQARLSSREVEAMIRQSLDVPASVSIATADNRVVLSGTAEPAWFETAVSRAADLDGLQGWRLDFGPLRESLSQQLATLAAELNGYSITFTRGAQMSGISPENLAPLGSGLDKLQSLAGALETEVAIRLEGYTDGVGTAERNREIALDRARAVQDRLRESGFNVDEITVAPGAWSPGPADLSQRKVVVFVEGPGFP